MTIELRLQTIAYDDPLAMYERKAGETSLVFETRGINRAYAQENILIPQMSLEIIGMREGYSIRALTNNGKKILRSLTNLPGEIQKTDTEIRAKNTRGKTHTIIRTLLAAFPQLSHPLAGLYGAFAYDLAREFANIGDRFDNNKNAQDPLFKLYLPASIISINTHAKTAEEISIVVDGNTDDSVKRIPEVLNATVEEYEDMSVEEYKQKVTQIQAMIRKGRFMQCVLSRTYGRSLQGCPLRAYKKIREQNPSPYSFFIRFGKNERLYGASPELNIKVKDREVEIRPIAGTARKQGSPLADFHARRELICSEKELAEHTMLVDLADNDISRVADDVRIESFGTIEEYPNLYHIVSGIKGTLKKNCDALDALIATFPAGTLTGAPKIEAMKAIEELEGSRRQYYGGAIGYLSFSGECNTGITIRSIHVKDGMSFVRSGAGIVYDSTPDGEAAEIAAKAEKAKKVLEANNE